MTPPIPTTIDGLFSMVVQGAPNFIFALICIWIMERRNNAQMAHSDRLLGLLAKCYQQEDDNDESESSLSKIDDR